MKTTTEYTIQGNRIEEHFENREQADDYFNSLKPYQRKSVQYFSKEWIIKKDGEATENEVFLIRNYSPEKI